MFAAVVLVVFWSQMLSARARGDHDRAVAEIGEKGALDEQGDGPWCRLSYWTHLLFWVTVTLHFAKAAEIVDLSCPFVPMRSTLAAHMHFNVSTSTRVWLFAHWVWAGAVVLALFAAVVLQDLLEAHQRALAAHAPPGQSFAGPHSPPSSPTVPRYAPLPEYGTSWTGEEYRARLRSALGAFSAHSLRSGGEYGPASVRSAALATAFGAEARLSRTDAERLGRLERWSWWAFRCAHWAFTLGVLDNFDRFGHAPMPVAVCVNLGFLAGMNLSYWRGCWGLYSVFLGAPSFLEAVLFAVSVSEADIDRPLAFLTAAVLLIVTHVHVFRLGHALRCYRALLLNWKRAAAAAVGYAAYIALRVLIRTKTAIHA